MVLGWSVLSSHVCEGKAATAYVVLISSVVGCSEA